MCVGLEMCVCVPWLPQCVWGERGEKFEQSDSAQRRPYKLELQEPNDRRSADASAIAQHPTQTWATNMKVGWGSDTENESTGNPSPMRPPGPFLMLSKRMWVSGIALRSWGLSLLLEYEMPLREEYFLHLVVASSNPSGMCLWQLL